ncbi:MAG: hypothetical protein Q7S60_01915 [bacterium]|nr:hypothetical protein [bacterium]
MNYELRIMKVLLFTFSFFIFTSAPAWAAQEATPATQSVKDTVREKVREKVEDLAHTPHALVGTLADISDSTLQVKTLGNGTEQAAIDNDTTFVRVTKGKSTEIKFADLVLKDFIIVMGFKNGNNILAAGRVITYDINPITLRRTVYGVVDKNEKGILTVRHPKTAESWTVATTSKTKVTKKGDKGFEDIKVVDIKVGDRVVAAGLPDEKKTNTLTAGRIHLIP